MATRTKPCRTSKDIDAFNGASGPKGLLTVLKGDHDSPVTPTGTASPSVVHTTIDFFDRYLKGESAAASRLVAKNGSPPADAEQAVRPRDLRGHAGQPDEIAGAEDQTRAFHATVTPTQGLTDGQVVTVSWELPRSGGEHPAVLGAATHAGQ